MIRRGEWTFGFASGVEGDREGILRGVMEPSAPYIYKVYKDDAQRHVFQLGTEQGPVLVKHFRLPRLKDKLRIGRFAQGEFMAHARAQARGLPLPKLLALYERRRCGIGVSCGLVYEFLEGFRDITQQETAFAAEMLAALYRGGVNHADFIRTNVMHNDATGETRLIDMENSTLLPPDSLKGLLMQTQRFIEFGGLGLEHPNSQALLRQVYEMANIATKLSFNAFMNCIGQLLTRHRSRKERRRLDFPPEVLEFLRLETGRQTIV